MGRNVFHACVLHFRFNVFELWDVQLKHSTSSVNQKQDLHFALNKTRQEINGATQSDVKFVTIELSDFFFLKDIFCPLVRIILCF